ncbi:MAG: beta-galactosidase [Candidatus Brocadiia bacterium]
MPLPRLSLGLAAALACGLAAGQDAEELELDHQMATDFETPHTKWARPYAGGTLRVLLLCNGRGTVPREGVELKQRFDLQVDAVFWRRVVDTTKEGWHGGELGLRRMLRLAAKPYDCYLFLGIRPTQLTHEMQYKVLKPVTEGAGIVLVGVNDERVLKPEHRLDEPPPFARQIGVPHLYKVKGGRGVRLPARPNIPYDVGWQTAYESWQERLGRAVLWAAGKAPQVEIQPRLGLAEFPRGELPRKAIGFAWRNPQRTELTFQCRLRRRDGAIVPLEGARSSEAEGEILRDLPALRADDYHLDVIARSRRGIEGWATQPFAIASEKGVGAVELERDWAEVGETLRGSVAPQPPLGEEEWLAVRLRDRRDRILAEKRLTKAEAFAFPVEAWMPMLLRVEAARCDGRGEVASAHAFFNVVKRHRGQFNFLIWDVPRGPLAPYAEESLARLGTTLQLAHGVPPRVVAAYDIAWVPYTTRILEKHDEGGVMKPFCWNDEAKVAAHVQALAEKHRGARQHGVFVYSLGDENDVRGSCASPHCLAAYRRYLEEAYGTIEALNASWGSAYESFDAVELLEPGDNQAAEARRQGNFPRWYDRQAFRSANYVQLCKAFAAAYRAMDPRALTGFEGAGRFARGDDIDLFVRELGFWSPYPGTADEVLRSIAPRDFPRANWMGYRKDATSLLAKYWRMVLHGCDSVWWWRWDGIGRFHGFLAPHLGPWPATRELAEDTQILRDGLGTLLLRSEMLDDGIAMVFSHPSLYAGQLEGSYGGVEGNHVAWHRAVEDLGLSFRYVTDRMLRLGEFDPRGAKVLILSRCEAIGPKAAGAIRDFVLGGGYLVADVRPGIYDGRCKPRPRGCLDDLFGVRRTGRPKAREGPASIEMEGLRVDLGTVPCDPAVEAVDGQAFGRCGDVPLMIANDAGAGGTLLLNFPMTAYPRLDVEGTPEEAAALFLRLAASAGIRPPVAVRSDGRRTRNLQTVRWRNDGLELVALFRHRGEDEQARVELDQFRRVYDLRRKRDLGLVKSFACGIVGSRPTWLLLAPRGIRGVKASLDRGEVVAGQRPVLRLQVPGAAGLHAVRIRATTPDGEPAEWLDQVVIVGAEPRKVTLPIALNDPPGQWIVRALDVYSERVVSVVLRVKPPGGGATAGEEVPR